MAGKTVAHLDCLKAVGSDDWKAGHWENRSAGKMVARTVEWTVKMTAATWAVGWADSWADW